MSKCYPIVSSVLCRLGRTIFHRRPYLIPASPGCSLALQISSQLFSCSQEGSGLGVAFVRPTPPVSKNIKSPYSISFFALNGHYSFANQYTFGKPRDSSNIKRLFPLHNTYRRRLEQSRKEKSSLSFSNSERHTLQYRL